MIQFEAPELPYQSLRPKDRPNLLQQVAQIGGIVAAHTVDVRLDVLLLHGRHRAAGQRQDQLAQRRQVLLLVVLHVGHRRLEALHNVVDADETVAHALRGEDDLGGVECPGPDQWENALGCCNLPTGHCTDRVAHLQARPA